MKIFTSGIDFSSAYIADTLPKNEFYAVKHGIKATSLRGIQDSQLALFKNIVKIFDESGIFYRTKKENEHSFVCFYGLNEGYVEAYAKIYGVHQNFSVIAGKMLGYPDCCSIGTRKDVSENPSFALKNTLAISQLDYHLNSIFHYGGKGNLQLVYTKNEGKSEVISEALSLIHHQPHSFECDASKRYALRLEDILKNTDPEYLQLIYQKTKKLYLYFDYQNWLCLSNTVGARQKLDIFDGILHDTVLIDFFSKVVSFECNSDLQVASYYDDTHTPIFPARSPLILNFC